MRGIRLGGGSQSVLPKADPPERGNSFEGSRRLGIAGSAEVKGSSGLRGRAVHGIEFE